MCSFIPKCQFLSLRVCFISESRVALAFLVELGAAMMVASAMVPERSNSGRSFSVRSDAAGGEAERGAATPSFARWCPGFRTKRPSSSGLPFSTTGTS
jgi:hypothetical protein